MDKKLSCFACFITPVLSFHDLSLQFTFGTPVQSMFHHIPPLVRFVRERMQFVYELKFFYNFQKVATIKNSFSLFNSTIHLVHWLEADHE